MPELSALVVKTSSDSGYFWDHSFAVHRCVLHRLHSRWSSQMMDRSRNPITTHCWDGAHEIQLEHVLLGLRTAGGTLRAG